MWPLVTSLRLRARAGAAKRSPTDETQNDPHVGKTKRAEFNRKKVQALKQ